MKVSFKINSNTLLILKILQSLSFENILEHHFVVVDAPFLSLVYDKNFNPFFFDSCICLNLAT
jgi:hypothetical protein